MHTYHISHKVLHGHDDDDRISQARKWHVHLQGAMGFIISRGPESYITGFAHQLFVNSRMTQVSKPSY